MTSALQPCYITDWQGTPPFEEPDEFGLPHVVSQGADLTGYLPGGDFIDLLYPDGTFDNIPDSLYVALEARAVPNPLPTHMVVTWHPTQDSSEFDIFGVPTHGTAGVGTVGIVWWPAIIDPTGDLGGYPLTAYAPQILPVAPSGVGTYPIYTTTIPVPVSAAYWYMFTGATNADASPTTGPAVLHIDFFCDSVIGASCYASIGFRAFVAVSLDTANVGRRRAVVRIIS